MSPLPEVEPLSGAFKALADPTRLRILALLARGELCVCHLEASLELPQPSVSRHLSVLRHAGLVRARREGSWSFYRLAEPPDPGVARVLASLLAELASDPTVEPELQRLRASRGPAACR